ncbi:MAG: BatA domain-containing protein [bacterium]
MFSFLNPWLALGALGVAAPVLIHFFFRRRVRNLEFPAMRFVLLSYKKVARKLKLQEYLLLLIRCLMALILPLALAVPLFARSVPAIKKGEKPVEAVMVMDTSMSMTRKDGDMTLFQKAREEAFSWAESMTEEDRLGVMDAVRLEGTDVSGDIQKVKDEIAAMKPAFQAARMNQALLRAAGKLSGIEEREQMIIVFTDLQKHGWQKSIKQKSSLPPVYIMDVAQELEPKNVTVTNLDIDWRALARDKAATLKATVANFGNQDLREAVIKVEFGQKTAAQGFVDLKAGEKKDKSFTLTEVPQGAGIIRLGVEDGMTADNAYHFHLKGGQRVRTLIVDGEPGTSYMESETYFLDQALNPRLYTRSRINPRTVTPHELNEEKLDDYQVLVLANTGELKQGTTERIKRFVKKGGGILLTLGDQVDADNYNARWGELLPRELRGVKLSYAGAQGKEEVRTMHLESPSADADVHPILTVFQEPGQGDLGLPGFRKYFLLQQEVDPKSKTILRLTDGTPMMVESDYGKGKVILFASSADREWNDFCIHPTYLPLFHQTVQYLADSLVMKDAGDIRAGSVVDVPVPSGVTGARVRGPDGAAWESELIKEKGSRRVRLSKTEKPGVYFIFFKGPEIPEDERRPASADRTVVINPDPAESDPAKATASQIEVWSAADQVTIANTEGAAENAQKSKLIKSAYAIHLLWILGLLFVAERILVRRG